MIGSKIANFQIIEELGKGGMGTVYKARDINLKRFVAIKVLNQGLLNKDSNYKRFKNEAEISAQINHPNVATLYNFLEIDGHAYIVMEYVNGITLEELIDEKGALNKQEAIDITIQILKGISAAHYLNILHRDLKPANVMISRNGYVKIMDFGIALMENSTRLTTQNKVIGTLNYMAPELFSGTLPSTSSDLYAVGVMFYEMLTGKSLYQADSEASLMYQIIHEKPQFLLKSAKQNLTPVLKMLVQKSANKRYSDSSKVIDALEEKRRNQETTPKIVLPNLRPVLSKIKRRLRLKTNFAKLPNIVKVSSTEKAKLNLFRFVNHRFLIICLVLTTVIIILSSSLNSSEISSGDYLSDQLYQHPEEKETYESSRSYQIPASFNVESPRPIKEEEEPIEIPLEKHNRKEIVKEAEKTPSEVELVRPQEKQKTPINEPIDPPLESKDEAKEIAKIDSEKSDFQPLENIKVSKSEEDREGKENEVTGKKKPFEVIIRQQRIGLRFTNTINSSDHEIGQEFSLETSEEISVDGVIVIPIKAEVRAVVSKKKTSNSGRVTFGIKFNQVKAINGEWLDLNYPEYSDIQKGEVIFQKGRLVNRVIVEASRLTIML